MVQFFEKLFIRCYYSGGFMSTSEHTQQSRVSLKFSWKTKHVKLEKKINFLTV